MLRSSVPPRSQVPLFAGKGTQYLFAPSFTTSYSLRGYSSSSSSDETPAVLRSTSWFGKKDRDGFLHRSWMRNQGLPDHLFDGRPVIGICNTWSELTPCNAHFRKLAEHVKRGVWEMGALPLEFPVTSLGETLMRPTAMLFRNLASMDVEETIRSNPLDGVVLLTGCDKTTPSLVMGALSVDLPTIVIPGGPMLNGRWRNQQIGENFVIASSACSYCSCSCSSSLCHSFLGSGTHVWKFAEMMRANEMTQEEFNEAECCMSRSAGHCMVMGTASTMACMVESLGLTLPGGAAIPAVDSRRYAFAHMTGRRIVEMVKEDLKLSKVLDRRSFENAIRVNGAIGGSTNAVVHLLAIAGRLDWKNVPHKAGQEGVTLLDWDELGKDVPCLLNLQPSGEYLMEDFYYAGGLPAVMKELAKGKLLREDAMTVSGKTMGENLAEVKNWNTQVVTTLEAPFKKHGGIIVLRGNLAPDGVVLKPSAASPHLMNHKGRAVVFENIEDLRARTDDPVLDIDENCVMVLKNCGPKGYPGMAEVGNMPLPKKLLEKGVKDLVRISDARMSGTAYGTVLLHTSPEAAIGGPLALVKDGDIIEIDSNNRRIHLHVDEAELQSRAKQWQPPAAPPTEQGGHRGYVALYRKHVQQAHLGADFDFLVGSSGHYIPRENH
ncbi:Dihydroxy-acid dehydratase [Balamuthia mandrillaris]